MLRKHIASLSREQTSIWCSPMFKCRRRGTVSNHNIRDRWPPVKLIVASGAAIIDESTLPGGSRFFSKPYNELSITEAMAHLLSSEHPHSPIA